MPAFVRSQSIAITFPEPRAVSSLRRCWPALAFIVLVFCGGGAAASDKNTEADVTALAAPGWIDPPVTTPLQLSALSTQYIACSAERGNRFITSSTAATEVISCSFVAPVAGFVIASGSGWLQLGDIAYEARATLSIDSTSFDSQADRYVDINPDAYDGTDKTVALSNHASVAAGSHTVRFLAARQSGTGIVSISDPTLNVLFVPAPLATQTTCGAKPGQAFDILGFSYLEMASCSITVNEPSIAFVIATGSVGQLGAVPVGAILAIREDGNVRARNYASTANNANDGIDESIAAQVAFPVSSGTRNVSIAATTQSGAGTLRIYDPIVSVITIPVSSAAICSSDKIANYENATANYTAATTCNMTLPEASRIMAFATATLSTGSGNNDYEANFRIAVDDLVGLGNGDRFVDVYLDSALGYTRVVDVQALREVGAGAHAVSFIGKRWRGPGRVSISDGYLNFLVLPSDRVFASGFDQ